MHKYICTIAQICALSSAVGRGSLAGNTSFVHRRFSTCNTLKTYAFVRGLLLAHCLAGEDALVLGGGVQRDHVEPLLGGDRVGRRVSARRDRHRLARRVVGDSHRPGERGGLGEGRIFIAICQKCLSRNFSFSERNHTCAGVVSIGARSPSLSESCS